MLLAQWCIFVSHSIPTLLSICYLKVISFYEPLKPFAIIVVEVIVLVAAILLYEKSRSKKNPAAGSRNSQADVMLLFQSYCCILT